MSIEIKHSVLLIEIERQCARQMCHAKTRLGLTKEEARTYCGFTCERCGHRTADMLTERDVPDWWEELMLGGLWNPDTVKVDRQLELKHKDDETELSEVVARLSDAYRQLQRQ